eukprot:4940041-Amphidinium_carterae.1
MVQMRAKQRDASIRGAPSVMHIGPTMFFLFEQNGTMYRQFHKQMVWLKTDAIEQTSHSG